MLYSILKKSGTDELHLFPSKKNDENKCIKAKSSICRKALLDDCEKVVYLNNCRDKNDTRELCASYGEPVCAACISALYATY
ncbi:MAG: hypothetical protein MJH11_15895 [Lentisphaeria bacterium]|nr:hypothetical protein [Lentisphaeria bacterium]